MMCFKSIAVCLLIILSSVEITGQKDVKLDWGKVSTADLEMKSYDLEPEASAVVLADIGEINFTLKGSKIIYRFNRHKRVKIFNENGYKYGDVAIPYYSHKNSQRIRKVKAQVINPDGKKTEVEEIYNEKYSKYWSKKRFSAPNIEDGSIVEFEYILESERFTELEDWFFQSSIPIRHSRYTVNVPSWFDYVNLTQGLSFINNLEENTNNSTNFATKSTKKKANIMHYKGNVISGTEVIFDVKNAKSLKKEEFITTMNDYFGRVRFQLSGVQFFNRPYEAILTSWEDIAKRFEKEINNDKREKVSNELMTELNMDINSLSLENAKSIVKYIDEKTKSDFTGGIFPVKNAKELLKTGQGTVADINYLLIAALRKAGYKADIYLKSTRSNGKTVEIYPILDQFNYPMAGIIFDNELILLDASGDNEYFGWIAPRALNKRAWRANEKYPDWVNIAPKISGKVFRGQATIDEEGEISLMAKRSFTNYAASNYTTSENTPHDFELAKSEECTISNLLTNRSKSQEGKLSDSFQATIEEYGVVTDSFIYFSPVLNKSFESNPFESEEREYPVEFAIAFNNIDM